MKENNDNINHPEHYNMGAIECIEAIESAVGIVGFEGYLVGNAMKYIWRYRHKGGVEDLKKASWYINKLIAVEEGRVACHWEEPTNTKTVVKKRVE